MVEDLERWARFTGNAVVARTDEPEGTRLVIRNGPAPPEEPRVRSVRGYGSIRTSTATSPATTAASGRRRAPIGAQLPLDTVRRLADEAKELGVEQLFLTGGEPLLLPDIAEMALACALAAPTTVLTNGMLFAGRRREDLARMPRDRIVLQISLDSATPVLHDLHRGRRQLGPGVGRRPHRARAGVPGSPCRNGRRATPTREASASFSIARASRWRIASSAASLFAASPSAAWLFPGRMSPLK